MKRVAGHRLMTVVPIAGIGLVMAIWLGWRYLGPPPATSPAATASAYERTLLAGDRLLEAGQPAQASAFYEDALTLVAGLPEPAVKRDDVLIRLSRTETSNEQARGRLQTALDL